MKNVLYSSTDGAFACPDNKSKLGCKTLFIAIYFCRRL